MTFGESIRIALRALLSNKLRAILTMLGIIIGVGAVITLMSVGKGVEQLVQESFQSIGSNLLFVFPDQLGATWLGCYGHPDVRLVSDSFAGDARCQASRLAWVHPLRRTALSFRFRCLFRYGLHVSTFRDPAAIRQC